MKSKRKKRWQKERWSKNRGPRPTIIAEDASQETGRSSLKQSEWAGPESPIGIYINEQAKDTLEAYRNQPNLIREQFNQEEDAKLGGYARRQLYELVQNGSDGLAGRRAGRICIWLTPSNLYCGDEGQAINEDGEKALMFSHLSPKRGTDEIGRFGLGFKSVLGVSDEPEFFSRSGSFRFSRARATSRIQTIVPEAKYCPVLRLPEAFEPRSEAEADHLLSSLMFWANNIVRLPLKPGAFEELSLQIRNFPSEFLLFVQHVSRFDLHIDELECREIAKRRLSQQIILSDGKDESRWMLSSKRHLLSKMAKSDSRNLDNETEVSISWAASFDRLNQPGRFWAYFPTLTSSLLSGILNAPWKTNEDRQNLLPGIYNDELVDAAAAMVARELRNLSTPDDPASHLDALPRRGEAGDTDYSGRLREQLHRNLQDYEILPDQTGTLRKLTEILYPPRELTSRGQAAEESLARWASQEIRPLRWLHHKALNRTRMAVIERLWDSESKNTEFPRATIGTWLEALLKNASTDSEELTASMVAVQTAFLIPKDLREQTHLGNIVLLANGQCVSPNPETVFLSGKQDSNSEFLVHPQLETDQDTLNALEGLGIGPVSPETDFKELTSRILTHVPFSQLFRTKNEEEVDHEDWMEFWHCSRNVKPSSAEKIIRDAFTAWKGSLYVKTVGGHWRTLYCALLPGPIVPGDGSRDEDVTIDVDFHAKDLPLLRQLGAVEVPVEGNELSPRMMWFTEIKARHFLTKRDLDRNPRLDKLNFVASLTSGPLDVLEFLSEEGRAQFTWHLLGLPATFQSWTMRHDTQNIYPPWETDSPALTALETHGRIRTHSRIQDLSYGLGDSPRDQEVLSELLSHPRSNLIREAFDLLPDIDSSWESFGDDAPIPLFDVWPGLRNLFPDKVGFLQLIRCDGFRNSKGYVDSYEPECISADDFIYLARMENEEEEIRTIIDVLKIDVGEEKVQELLLRLPSQDIQKERDLVRDCPNDEERLLAAVGEEELRRHLPPTLLAILETDQEQLSGITLAKCAISTFHTGALREYRHVLTHLGPPFRWAGSLRAKEFVTALGFNEAWAGDSNPRRPPFLEVDGPFSLPKLHDFQRKIVGNVRRLIRSQEVTTGRRGMISMPTGSGKTRVAVQAIVESIRDDGFEGGILWVADRDELCEQAVEAWRQVWSSKGAPK